MFFSILVIAQYERMSSNIKTDLSTSNVLRRKGGKKVKQTAWQVEKHYILILVSCLLMFDMYLLHVLRRSMIASGVSRGLSRVNIDLLSKKKLFQ